MLASNCESVTRCKKRTNLPGRQTGKRMKVVQSSRLWIQCLFPTRGKGGGGLCMCRSCRLFSWLFPGAFTECGIVIILCAVCSVHCFSPPIWKGIFIYRVVAGFPNVDPSRQQPLSQKWRKLCCPNLILIPLHAFESG